MKLVVENLGPIKHGEIDLAKDFYVFVGYNNSGKTYMSQLLWTVLNFETIFEFAEGMSEKLSIKGANNDCEVDKALIQRIILLLETFLNNFYVDYSFQTENNDFFKRQGFNLKFRYDIDEEYNKLVEVLKNSKWSYTEQDNVIKLTLSDMKSLARIKDNFFEGSSKKATDKLVVILITSSLLDHDKKIFFLPSTRTFFLAFYEYIYRVEKDKKDAMDKRIAILTEKEKRGEKISLQELNVFRNPYTKPVNQLLKTLYTLKDNYIANQFYVDLAEKMKELIGGDIALGENEIGEYGIEEYRFQPKGTNRFLPMFLSSSSVNQLSTLYQYLLFWANEGKNFLIIDEPEQNLHPENQLKLLDILIQFSQRNQNKVLITTHSPLITDAVNNYLMLGALENRAQVAEEMGMSKDFLTAENTGIYYFSGDRIQEYVIGDYGTIFKDFKAVVDKVEEQKFDLGNMLFQQNEKKAKAKKKTKQTQKQAQ
jgi:AAA15 family ATPase/GTPase